jgi:RND family efflux transporter MFP subunit
MDESNAKNADLAALKIDRSGKKSSPGRRKKWLHLLWLLLPVVLYFAYQMAIEKVTPAVKVRTASVQMITGSEAAAELVATGYVVAQVKAAVASKATGRLRILNVEEGDSALEGDILAELENDDINADVDLARANLKRSLADSVAGARNFDRQQDLYNKKLISEEVFEMATAIYARAIAEVEAMQAMVTSAQVAFENTIIRAPFDGTVLTKHADVGEMVAPFASAVSSKGAVVTMADMKSLEVEADVSESNIQKVTVGGPCEIILDAYPGQVYSGFVKKIVPTADRARATVLTKIAFDEIDDRVLPEMSARVNFLPVETQREEAEIEPVMAIPNTALTTRNEQRVVFVVVDNIVQQTPLTVGRKLGDVTEVVSGLKLGDVVVLSPAGGLESGDKIEITN